MGKLSELIGTEKYFVHKGTWDKNYEWRIEKVKINGIEIDETGDCYVKFGFACVGYTYPISYLKNTLEEAKTFAIKQITEEKKRQIAAIKKYE